MKVHRVVSDPQNYNISNVVTAFHERGFAISGDTAMLY